MSIHCSCFGIPKNETPNQSEAYLHTRYVALHWFLVLWKIRTWFGFSKDWALLPVMGSWRNGPPLTSPLHEALLSYVEQEIVREHMGCVGVSTDFGAQIHYV